MYSTYSLSGDIFTINLNVEDFKDLSFGVEILNKINKSKFLKVICNLYSVEIITQEDIKNIDKLVALFKFNNIHTIVCGVNANSASVLFHFLDDFKFQTARNIQRAIDDFKY